MLRKTAICLSVMVATVAAAPSTPRDSLVQVAFFVNDRDAALATIGAVEANTRATLARAPGDREAAMVRAMAVTSRAKLAGSRADALAARALLEALVTSNPRDPEAQAALGSWHIGGVVALGGFMGRAALGARKSVGLGAIETAVKLGGIRAMFLTLAGLLRLQLDAKDPRAPKLLEAAMRAATPTLADRLMQRHAQRMLAILKSGDEAAVRKAASRLMPLGQLDK